MIGIESRIPYNGHSIWFQPMKSISVHLPKVRIRLTTLGLMCAATLISLVLFRLRTLLSGSIDYAFLVWNLFLAWIPLGLAYAISTYTGRRRSPLMFSLPAIMLLWLIFFPNAPYLLTDFQHLGIPRSGVPLWFDTLLLIWFAWTGLLIGLVSLFLMHGFVRREFGRLVGWFFVTGVGFLTGLGIYIGRFLRWNSWDLFLDPLVRMSDFMYYASHPSMRSIMFIGAFSAFFLFSYISLYTFGYLVQEQILEEMK